MDLRRGTQAAVEAVIKYLEVNKKEITTSAEIAQVATISANGVRRVSLSLAALADRSFDWRS